MTLCIFGNSESIGSQQCFCSRVEFRVLKEVLNSSTNTLMTYTSRGILESLIIYGFFGDGIEEMIQIILKLISLIHVSLVVEQSRRSDYVVVQVMLINACVEFLHEEFIAKSDESARDVAMNNIMEEGTLVDLIEYLLIRVVERNHIGVIASSYMESQEIFQWLERPI